CSGNRNGAFSKQFIIGLVQAILPAHLFGFFLNKQAPQSALFHLVAMNVIPAIIAQQFPVVKWTLTASFLLIYVHVMFHLYIIHIPQCLLVCIYFANVLPPDFRHSVLHPQLVYLTYVPPQSSFVMSAHKL